MVIAFGVAVWRATGARHSVGSQVVPFEHPRRAAINQERCLVCAPEKVAARWSGWSCDPAAASAAAVALAASLLAAAAEHLQHQHTYHYKQQRQQRQQ